MRRWLLLLAAAGLVALGMAVLVAWLLPAPPPTAAEQAQRLAAELRCPDCQALSVAESHTAAADAIRAEIAEQLAAGRSVDEVRQHFVDRFGQWILLQPSQPLIWLLPGAVIAIGVAVFAWWLLAAPSNGTDANADGSAEPAADDQARQAVRDELEALDG